MLSGMPFTAFHPRLCQKRPVLVRQKIRGRAYKTLFEIDKSVYFNSSPIGFEYSSPPDSGNEGHRQYGKFVGYRHATFIPPSDFTKLTVEGQSRYWIRLVDENGASNDPIVTTPM